MRYGLRFGQSDELNLRSSSRCGKFLKELDWTDWTLTSLKFGRDKTLLEVGLVSYVWETFADPPAAVQSLWPVAQILDSQCAFVWPR